MSYKRGQLAKKLLYLIATGTMIPAAIIAPNLPRALLPLLRKLQKDFSLPAQPIRKSLTALKRKRLIRQTVRNGRTILTLSEKGRRTILSFDIENMEIGKPKKWDGLWRLVIFDIPESQKKAREALRFHLRKLGFYQLQKSCFVHPFECKKEIDFITEFYQIPHHINYIVARKVEGEEELRNFYGL